MKSLSFRLDRGGTKFARCFVLPHFNKVLFNPLRVPAVY